MQRTEPAHCGVLLQELVKGSRELGLRQEARVQLRAAGAAAVVQKFQQRALGGGAGGRGEDAAAGARGRSVCANPGDWLQHRSRQQQLARR